MNNNLYEWWVYILDVLAAVNIEAVDTFGFILGSVTVVGLLLLVGLGFIAVRAPGRVSRWTAVSLVLLSGLTFLMAINLQQSLPRDMTPELQRLLGPKGLRISNYKIKAPNHIYFSVDVGNVSHWYRVDWSKVAEDELLKQQKEAAEGGRDGNNKPQGIMLQFMPSDENREMPHFYLHPWPAQPSKGTMERPYEFAPQPINF